MHNFVDATLDAKHYIVLCFPTYLCEMTTCYFWIDRHSDQSLCAFFSDVICVCRTAFCGGWKERERRRIKRSCVKHLVSALSLSPQKFQHNMFFFQPLGFACCRFPAPPSLMYGKDLCLGKITGTGLCFPREGSSGCTSPLCCGKGSVTLRSRELIKFHSQRGEEECQTEARSTGRHNAAKSRATMRGTARLSVMWWNGAQRRAANQSVMPNCTDTISWAQQGTMQHSLKSN